MANRRLISSAISESRLGVFADIIAEQFEDIDLSKICIYLYDVVDSSALPWLAKQLDVDGFKGYDQCLTEKDRRELLKNAINLHQHIGTISAIEKAVGLAGFDPKNVGIEENVPIITGGTNVWCAFRLRLNPLDLGIINSKTLKNLKIYLSYYKPVRSILTEIYFGLSLEDNVFLTSESDRDELTIQKIVDVSGDFNNDFGYDFY